MRPPPPGASFLCAWIAGRRRGEPEGEEDAPGGRPYDGTMRTDYYGEPLPDLTGLRCPECGLPLDADPQVALVLIHPPDPLNRQPPRARRRPRDDRVLHWACWQERLRPSRRGPGVPPSPTP
jgi:hypothetical protein